MILSTSWLDNSFNNPLINFNSEEIKKKLQLKGDNSDEDEQDGLSPLINLVL